MPLNHLTVGQLLGATHRKVGLGWQIRLKTVGLTMRRHIILRTLSEEGPLCQKDIANHIFADPTSLSRTVRALLAAGLVQRAETATDRRQVVLELTEAGRERLRLSMAIGTDYNAAMTAGFQPGEIETLRAMLRRLIDNVQVSLADAGGLDER